MKTRLKLHAQLYTFINVFHCTAKVNEKDICGDICIPSQHFNVRSTSFKGCGSTLK